jgi:carbamoyl-phosphate synthase large subunit
MKKSDDFNILITNVGRRVTIVKAFRNTLDQLEISGKIIGVDASNLAPAHYVADKSLLICKIAEDDYIPTLLDLCAREEIKLVVSLLDTDLLKLAENREIFQAEGVFVLISSPEVVRLSRDKRLTYNFFSEHNILTPRLLSYEEALQKKSFPLFIKPIDGSASNSALRIENQRELEFFATYVPHPMIMEYIPGTEYTIDIFIDLEAQVRALVPRKRLEVRAGEVSKSQIVLDKKILAAARQVAEALASKGALGVINIQCIYTPDQEIKFIEVNPRFGGGNPLSIQAGYPFPQWVVEMAKGKELSPLPEDLGNGLTMLRYDDAIFIRPNGENILCH